MDEEECNTDNIVKKLTDNLSSYIESMPTDKLEKLLFVCNGGSLDWFENSIAELVGAYTKKELEERNIKND
jgi:hypothetical protein